ncbi:hypothetical protein [Halalkalirubrum salinum]|nr:hypothetical protein [Halalkalirubrum salinum]
MRHITCEDPWATGDSAEHSDASLGDILPGESKGTDLTIDNLDDIIYSE